MNRIDNRSEDDDTDKDEYDENDYNNMHPEHNAHARQSRRLNQTMRRNDVDEHDLHDTSSLHDNSAAHQHEDNYTRTNMNYDDDLEHDFHDTSPTRYPCAPRKPIQVMRKPTKRTPHVNQPQKRDDHEPSDSSGTLSEDEEDRKEQKTPNPPK